MLHRRAGRTARPTLAPRLALETLEVRDVLNGTYHSLAGGNFSQDWTNTDLITADDNWANVPSIIGYLGDTNASSPTGVDPQTILVSSLGAEDVNANRSDPNSFATGGVAEFDRVTTGPATNPTIALNGSGTADTPGIVIFLDTTGRTQISISYVLRDLDGSVDNSIQPFALQYRVGEAGNFTNVAAGFVADASRGPSLAGEETMVSVTLPSAIDNQSQVQLRILTTNAVGNDEWVGIDNILVTSSAIGGAGTPSVTNATTNEDTQSNSGLVITRNGGTNDTTTHYKITGISNGRLFLNDGTTEISNGSFITVAQGTAGLKFTPASNFFGEGSFLIRASTSASDAGLGGTEITAKITVNSVNDAPAGSDRSATIDEDAFYALSATDFGFTDPNDSTAANAFAGIVVGSLPTAGTLALSGTAVTSGQFVTASDIAAGRLVFTPVSNANGTPYASFTFFVRDDGGTDNGGKNTDESANTFTLNVNAVNDAPVVSAPATASTNEDIALVFSSASGNAISVSDVDATALSVTLTATGGVLTLGGTSGLSVTGNGTSSVTLSGAIADINTGLNGTTFTPALNSSGAASVKIDVTDNGQTGSGGTLTGSKTVNITVNAVNDAPAGTDGSATISEDGSYTFGATDFGFTDPSDTPANAFAGIVVGSLPTAGTLALSGTAVTSGQFVTASDIAAGRLVFAPVVQASGTPYASFTFFVRDDGGTDNGGKNTDESANTFTLNVNAVNDAPVVSAPTTASTVENTPRVFSSASGNAISVSDVDAGTASVTVTLNVTNGTATLGGTANLTVTGNGTDTVTLSGAIADINAGLNGTTFTPTTNFNGPATLKVSANDNGNTGSGGSLTDSKTISITVSAVNDAPVVTTSNGTTDYTENGSAPVDTMLTVSDSDSPFLSGARVSITGNFVGTEDALTFTAGGGISGNYDSTTGVLTLTGSASASAYEAVLQTVAYSNSSDNPSTLTRTITFTVNDGFLDSAAATKDVNVIAVNDAPTVSAPTTASTNEDVALVFSSANMNAITVSDVDATALSVTLTATGGVLTLGGTSGLSVTGNGTSSVTLSGAIADINTGLNGTTFTPALNSNGAASVTIRADDNGQTGSGGSLFDSKTVNVTVNAVNDPPIGASFTVTTNEDAPFTFSAANFGFTDPSDTPANAFAGIVVGSLPTAGTLALSGTAVTSGQFVTASDIAAGLLVFTPADNANGTAYASFTFRVRDDGDGSNTDLAARTATIDVDAANDDPIVTLAQNSFTLNVNTAVALDGFAMFAAGGGTDEANQTAKSYSATATNGALFSAAPMIDANGRLTFTASGTTGTTTVTVTVTDSAGATSAAVTFSVTVETATITPSPQVPVNVAIDPTARFIAAGADAGSNGTVALFDARTGAALVSFQPFGNFGTGVAVALGDLTGDGTAELIVATRGSIGLLSVYDLATGATLVSAVRPFAGLNTGLQITTADVDGDGVHDLVFSPERGAPTVAAFSFTKAQFVSVVNPLPGANLNFQLAAGNVTGDGRAEVILSANGFVAVFDPSGAVLNAFPVAPGFGGEMAIAVGDTNGDGQREIVLALQAPGGDTAVAAFSAEGALVWSLFADTGAGMRRDGTNRPAVQTAPRLAVADVTGDRIADVLLGSQPGAGTSRVTVFDGATRQQVRNDLAFGDTLGLFTDAG